MFVVGTRLAVIKHTQQTSVNAELICVVGCGALTALVVGVFVQLESVGDYVGGHGVG